MKRIIPLLIIALLMTMVSAAFAYDPNPLTRLEVQEAAAFTDGIVFPCPNSSQQDEIYRVCVDATRTPWDMYQLADWADYGLTSWTRYEAWARDGQGGLSSTWIHLTREEILLIGVRNGHVLYLVTTLK